MSSSRRMWSRFFSTTGDMLTFTNILDMNDIKTTGTQKKLCSKKLNNIQHLIFMHRSCKICGTCKYMYILMSFTWNALRPNSWTKARQNLQSFPSCYSQPSLQLCLEISISSNSRNLLHIKQLLTNFYRSLLYTVKEKWGKPNRIPYLLVLPYGSMF